MRNAVLADRLPYYGVGVGERVADDVGAQGEVGVEFEEVGLDLLEVEGLERLGALLPFGDLRVHVGGGYGARIVLSSDGLWGWEKDVVGWTDDAGQRLVAELGRYESLRSIGLSFLCIDSLVASVK